MPVWQQGSPTASHSSVPTDDSPPRAPAPPASFPPLDVGGPPPLFSVVFPPELPMPPPAPAFVPPEDVSPSPSPSPSPTPSPLSPASSFSSSPLQATLASAPTASNQAAFLISFIL